MLFDMLFLFLQGLDVVDGQCRASCISKDLDLGLAASNVELVEERLQWFATRTSNVIGVFCSESIHQPIDHVREAPTVRFGRL